MPKNSYTGLEVAIVGMACRFPDAQSPEAFWQNILRGHESVRPLSDVELAVAGVDPDVWKADNYVRAASRLSGIEQFDADFFGITPREAALLDPQHRLFLESCWHALEDAGYAARSKRVLTGIYAGCGPNTYLTQNVAPSHDFRKEGMLDSMPGFQAMLGNDKDYLSTRTAYKLGLKGPAINIQTACSTSLVALHLASRGLQTCECDLALAGGVTILVPDGAGYTYQDAMILSSDGHCRPFDAKANGTVFGSGVGVLALRRLEDALADGDTIHAVIKGSAINNDGGDKVSFSAPSVDGQASVIRQALEAADVSPDAISYIETHGTGTLLGDPIEIEALANVFTERTAEAGPITIGSVKSNLGHLIAAAGVASVIKTVMAMKAKTLPPSINFNTPNREIDFDHLPFTVNTSPKPWIADQPLRAGVSSFGVGGTNAHVVLEQAPENQSVPLPSAPTAPLVLALSARNPAALRELTDKAIKRLTDAEGSELHSICYTAGVGRQAFEYRLFSVADNAQQLASALRTAVDDIQFVDPSEDRSVAALFTGQGGQSEAMGRALYDSEPVFREIIDACSIVLERHLERPLLDVLYGDASHSRLVHDTAYTQPALFAVEYALYKLWKSRGIEPRIVLGHSVGEYVAACVAGVFSLEDGLRLIAKRGALMSALPRNGTMLAVSAAPGIVRQEIGDLVDLVSIAAENGPLNTVVAGDVHAIERLAKKFTARGTVTTRLKVSHAFHSPLMVPILEEFHAFAETIAFHPPKKALISNVTSKLADSSIASAKYWTDHIRQPVLFHQSLLAAREIGATVFLEMGPHPVLCGMGQAALADEDDDETRFIPSLHRDMDDRKAMAVSTGRLFCAGIPPDWSAFCPTEARRIVDFPLYPFQRRRFWIEAESVDRPVWHCRREWMPIDRPKRLQVDAEGRWLIVGDAGGLAGRLAEAISTKWGGKPQTAIIVTPGKGDTETSDGSWKADLRSETGVHALVDRLRDPPAPPIKGVLFTATGSDDRADPATASPARASTAKLLEVARLQQAMSEHPDLAQAKLWIVGQGARQLPHATATKATRTDISSLSLTSAALHGLAMVLANEHPDSWGGDIDLSEAPEATEIEGILPLLIAARAEMAYALRGEQTYALRIVGTEPSKTDVPIDPENVYLVTGGLGALGAQVAQWLIDRGARRLLLVGRNLDGRAKAEALGRLRESGVEVAACAADVADLSAMSKIISDLTNAGRRLGGVVHTAGVVEDGMVSSIDAAAPLERALRPKLDGTLVLDQLTREIPLDFFICFSSISALLGMKGQAGYVAANAAMNHIVERRNALGLPGLSIEWGPWSQAGMAANLDDQFRRRLMDFGLFGIDTQDGLDRLGALLGTTGTITAAPVMWKRYAQKQYGTVPSVLREFLTQTDGLPAGAVTAPDAGTLAGMFASVEETEREGAILTFLRERVAKLLGVSDMASLPVDEALNRMGFDSLTTIEFRNSLTRLDVKVSLQKLVMGATLGELASDFASQIAAKLGTSPAGAVPAVVSSSAIGEDSYDKNCIIIPRPKPDAAIRLIGFPYAGGGPLVFQSWVNKLPDFIELGILQLPGRSARLKEPFHTRMEEMVDALVPDMVRFLDKPFAFFGHCVGGVQSFEVAQRLRREYGLEPVHLFVAGGRSPQIYNDAQFSIDVQQFNHETGRAEHELDESDFIEMLREVNFANNKALFEDKEMRDIMLPIIQADYEINNYYRYSPTPPLNTPITAIGGRIDPYVTGEHIYGWKEHTTGEFKVHFCAGDHYFMEHQGDLLTRIAAEDLARFAPHKPRASADKQVAEGVA